MSAHDRLTNQQRSTSTDQEHENGPPGGMEARGSNWHGAEAATALKEQQDADVGEVTKVADKIDGGGTFDTT